jgi:UDP-2-acetamido-2,6-beta-L-arabino-hexul-4-ose reductase
MDKLKVGITGVDGFIGSHLRDRLTREEEISLVPFEDSFFEEPDRIKAFLSNANVVVHLAAINRGEPDELYNTNVALVTKLVSHMEELKVKPHVIFSSSIQNVLDNPYGLSKKEGERILENWSKRNNAPVTILVIPNVYGDRCRPHYNSVVATFCYELTHGGKPEIHIDKELELIYVNELVEIIWDKIRSDRHGFRACTVKGTAKAKVSKLLDILLKFKEFYIEKHIVPNLETRLAQNLYNVFLSYLDYPAYQQKPRIHSDDRGILFEIVKQEEAGQIFYSTTKPGVVRGNHYHTRKVEKFCVVQGDAIIRLRRIGTNRIIEYRVSEREPGVVEIPIFHTHNIENIGEGYLHTLFWANELYDPEDSDTYYEKV